MILYHIVNPFNAKAGDACYLDKAQPITYQSMLEAQAHAAVRGLSVRLCAAVYPEDQDAVPAGFHTLPLLQHSTATTYPEISQGRKLPFLQEIVNLICDYATEPNAWVVLTNVDIGIQRYFYTWLASWEVDLVDGFSIHRRDDIPRKAWGRELTATDLDLVYSFAGKSHGGHDCFVAPVSTFRKINMGMLFTGYPPWGIRMRNELRRHSRCFRIVKNSVLTFHIGADEVWRDSNNALYRQNEANRTAACEGEVWNP